MKNYKVTFSVLFKPTFEVEADSPEEAQKIAEEEITESIIEDAAYSQGLVSVMGVEVDVPKVEVDNSKLAQAKAKEALDRITRQYLALTEEFAQYRREAIWWMVEDFLEYRHPTHTITLEEAQVALEDMIHNHDPEVGITWKTVAKYIEEYGSKR